MDNYEHTYKGYSIVLREDSDPISPRDWCNLGTMVCWHRRYILGDVQPRESPSAWVSSMWAEYGTDEECREIVAAAIQGKKLSEAKDVMQEREYRWTIREHELVHPVKHSPEALIMIPLYMYDHSGISISASIFSCPWDSGQIGWIYAETTEEFRALNTALLLNEVATYDTYLQGDIWGYAVSKEGEELDACWGYYGINDALESAKECIDAIAG